MSNNLIKNKRQAKKAGLGDFYQKMVEFFAQNETHEMPGVSLGIKNPPVLDVFGGYVVVGIQRDFIRPEGVERLPKPWFMIRTDEGQHDSRGHGEQLLEVSYDRNQISDNK